MKCKYCGEEFQPWKGCPKHGSYAYRKAPQNVPSEFSAVLDAIREVRKSDCGAWLKDCQTVMFTCAEGEAKRFELMRRLNDLYKIAGV